MRNVLRQNVPPVLFTLTRPAITASTESTRLGSSTRYAHPNIVNKELIEAMSDYLQGQVTILNGDYQTALATADEHSFVYLDPPYMPISSSASFTRYTEGGFGYKEQERLKETCDDLRKRKVHFLESNSDCDKIRKLYSNYNIKIVEAKRSVNSKANKRGAIKEVLIHG